MTAIWIVLALLALAAAGGFCLWWFWWRLLPVSWKKCTLASLWDGSDAQRRMMNMLSPHMSEGKFREYLKWQKSRGCNTVHLILANQNDGENAGYSIYGAGPVIDWTVDKGVAGKMLERIKECRKAGMGVVLWPHTDDGTKMNDTLMSDPDRYAGELKKLGFFRYASIVCLGLELSDYASVPEAGRFRDALRKVWRGKIATHDVSNSLRFAGLGDIVFAQVKPSTSDAEMLRFAARVKATGKPCGIIEHRRYPDRARCQKLIDAGLPFVGNW